MNAQEIFDTVATHLLKQNARSMGGIGDGGEPYCRYRGDAGRKCAIGCLIPDEVYTTEMERNPVGALTTRFKEALPSYFREHIALLCDLQTIHDQYEPSGWRDGLAYLGKRAGFDLRVLAGNGPERT